MVRAGREVSIQVPTSSGAGGGDGPAGELMRAGFLVGGTFFLGVSAFLLRVLLCPAAYKPV